MPGEKVHRQQGDAHNNNPQQGDPQAHREGQVPASKALHRHVGYPVAPVPVGLQEEDEQSCQILSSPGASWPAGRKGRAVVLAWGKFFMLGTVWTSILLPGLQSKHPSSFNACLRLLLCRELIACDDLLEAGSFPFHGGHAMR